ncbi:hypothetical protein [Anaeromyxobacter oryzisoli]|uniref:hypothetical protein n=1 Tax=Anaeromyxobacter oryzisoli TaxID=2925408 RepID=UPI001F561FB2|nr:hypothetical protein [Anaeromyxobacter sp. SG63]
MNGAGPSQRSGSSARTAGRGRRGRLAGALFAAAALVAAAACRRDEVSHFRVPKSGAPAGLAAGVPGAGAGPMGSGPTAAPAGGAMDGAEVAPPPPPAGGGLRWSLPKGWSEAKEGGPMRYATLRPGVPGKVEVSVIVLPGPAGGELANVNRWRNQIGLPPLAEAELPAARRTVKAGVGPVAVYDFTSEGRRKSRVVAGLAANAGSTWFVKLSGDAEAVSAARPAFMTLLESLRPDAEAK